MGVVMLVCVCWSRKEVFRFLKCFLGSVIQESLGMADKFPLFSQQNKRPTYASKILFSDLTPYTPKTNNTGSYKEHCCRFGNRGHVTITNGPYIIPVILII